MPNPRETVLSALVSMRRNGAWSDGVLKDLIKRDGLDSRDAALATRICGGVLQNLLLCDFYISSFCSVKIDKLQPIVRDILRIGVYQIVFMDRIPQSAAVNEAVTSTRKHANPKAAGMVNGVLRSLCRSLDNLPQPKKEEYLSVKYSHPQWLCGELAKSVGIEQLEPLLAANNVSPMTVAQVNTTKFASSEAKELLAADGVEFQPHDWMKDCLLLKDTGSIEALTAFQTGAITVQDAAAKLAVAVSGVKPGDTVIDGCAAPGGKSFAAAISMKDKGRVLSFDIHQHKIKLIAAGAERLGLECIEAQVGNGKQPDESLFGIADVVLADVPCSGFGVIRKKPEIRYKKKQDAENMPAIQLDILTGLSKCVKPGGVLLYSTCTVLKQENELVVEEFLNNHPEFSAEDFETPVGKSTNGMITLLPHLHNTDGFFICKLRKIV